MTRQEGDVNKLTDMCLKTNCETLKQIIKYSAHAHNKSNIWSVNCALLKAYSCVGPNIVIHFQH